MAERYAVLPCNGIDKKAGRLSGEIAVAIGEKSGAAVLCPVFYRVSDIKYNAVAAESRLIAVDGCPTRCASKLAAEKGLKVFRKINVTEAAREAGFEISPGLRLSDGDTGFCGLVASGALESVPEKRSEAAAGEGFGGAIEYVTYSKDKFIFRLPKNDGFLFNENDCWAYVIGGRARIGVTDFVQKSLSDILYFFPPDVGAKIEQFGEAGSIESAKAVVELISPVSGTVVAVNEKLEQNPEFINDNPYEKGWIAEIELTDLEGDRELLIGFEKYFEIMKKKVDEFHV